MTIIVDYGIGNVFSVQRSFEHCGDKNIKLSNDPHEIKDADRVILPGVGAFKSGMNVIKKHNYDEKIFNYLIKKDSFVYGICLGMQLLFEKSYEFGLTKGLGLIKGDIVEFKKKNKKIKTNIGWCKTNFVEKMKKKKLKKFNNKHFYFVHSFYTKPIDNSNILAKTSHGGFMFTSAIKKDNVLGTQFHPEKSGNLGIDFLKNLKKYKS